MIGANKLACRILYLLAILAATGCAGTRVSRFSYQSDAYKVNVPIKDDDCYDASVLLNADSALTKDVANKVVLALDTHVFAKSNDTSVYAVRHRRMGSGGEELAVEWKPVEGNKTFVTATTDTTVLGYANQRAWSCAIVDKMVAAVPLPTPAGPIAPAVGDEALDRVLKAREMRPARIAVTGLATLGTSLGLTLGFGLAASGVCGDAICHPGLYAGLIASQIIVVPAVAAGIGGIMDGMGNYTTPLLYSLAVWAGAHMVVVTGPSDPGTNLRVAAWVGTLVAPIATVVGYELASKTSEELLAPPPLAVRPLVAPVLMNGQVAGFQLGIVGASW